MKRHQRVLSFVAALGLNLAGCIHSRSPASTPTIVSAWSSAETSFVKSNFTNPFPDPYVASVWGSIQNKTFVFSPSRRLSTQIQGSVIFDVKNPRFEKGSLQTLLFLQKREGAAQLAAPKCKDTPASSLRGRVAAAPLMVILPGTFNNPADTQCRRFVDQFASRGYHVLVIPNSLGDHYLSRKPNFSPGNLIDEAQVVLDAITKLKQTVGPDAISSVNMVGASYGGLLSVVTQNIDTTNIVDGTVSVFSPPLNFIESMTAFDKMIKSSGTNLDRVKEDQLDIVKSYLLANKQSDLPATGFASAAQGASVFGMMGFQDWLTVAAKTIHESYGIGRVPDSSLKFSEFSNEYLTKAPLKLDYATFSRPFGDWVSENKRLGKTVRVMSAVDDVINPDPLQWKNQAQTFNDQNLILLPSSGHLSMISYDWFEKFLSVSYGERRKVQSVFDQGLVSEVTSSTESTQRAIIASELLLAAGLAFPDEIKMLVDKALHQIANGQNRNQACSALVATMAPLQDKLSLLKRITKFGIAAAQKAGAVALYADSNARVYMYDNAKKDPGTYGSHALLMSYLREPGCLQSE